MIKQTHKQMEVIMKRFDIIDLENTETYKTNPDLEKFCRQFCNANFRELGHETRAQAREAVFSGKHAVEIATAWDGVVANNSAAEKQRAQYIEAVTLLALPDEYSVMVDGESILLAGPYNAELPKRLRRQGGYWDRDRKIWVLPLAAATSLGRIFKNATKKTNEINKKINLSELNRWLGYVEDKAARGWIYEKGVSRLVDLGISKHPDLKKRLDIALSNAKNYVRPDISTAPKNTVSANIKKTHPVNTGPQKTGQLWEPCHCGREPIYMPLMLCDRCWPKTSQPERINTTCREPYRRGIGQGFGSTEDGQ